LSIPIDEETYGATAATILLDEFMCPPTVIIECQYRRFAARANTAAVADLAYKSNLILLFPNMIAASAQSI